MDGPGQEQADDPVTTSDAGAGAPAPTTPAAASAGVPLAAVEALLRQVADAVHDRPVQQLVAAKLMVETAAISATAPTPATDVQRGTGGSGADVDLLGRSAAAIGRAGEQARDLMWALAAPVLRADHLAEDAEDALTRTGSRVRVAVDPAADPGLVEAVVRAAHRLLAGCLLAGATDVSVVVTADATTASARLWTSGSLPSTEPLAPWLALATEHLDPVGGTLAPEGGADGSGPRAVTRSSEGWRISA